MPTQLIETSRYKLFPNTYTHEVSGDCVGIFHPLTLKITYISSKTLPVLEFLKKPKPLDCLRGKFPYLKKIDTDLKKLIKNEILVDETFSYKEKIRSIRDKIICQEPRLCVGYFIVSEYCNLKCRYCFIEGGMTSSYKRKNMPMKTAFEAAAFFNQNAYRENNYQPIIVFYGGEPLLNFDAVKLITLLTRKYEPKINLQPRTKILVITNATILTKEIVRFFAKTGINVGVSMDGFEDVHDKPRIDNRGGLGSFKETLKGYNMLRKGGITPSVSCTIGRHNAAFLPKIAEYFASELKVSTVGFNLMYEYPCKENLFLPNIDEVSAALIKAYEILRNHGIYEDRIGRHLTSQGNLKFYPYDCAGCGKQLVFLPNGDFGPCHAYFPSKRYFFGNIFKPTQNIFQHRILKLWRNRSPFNMEKCNFCPAISICGGGCAYNAGIKTGSLFEKDERYCRFYNNYFLKWYIEDRYKEFQKNNISTKNINA